MLVESCKFGNDFLLEHVCVQLIYLYHHKDVKVMYSIVVIFLLYFQVAQMSGYWRMQLTCCFCVVTALYSKSSTARPLMGVSQIWLESSPHYALYVLFHLFQCCLSERRLHTGKIINCLENVCHKPFIHIISLFQKHLPNVFNKHMQQPNIWQMFMKNNYLVTMFDKYQPNLC